MKLETFVEKLGSNVQICFLWRHEKVNRKMKIAVFYRGSARIKEKQTEES